MHQNWKLPLRAIAAMVLIAAVRLADLNALTPVPPGQKPMFPVLTRMEMLNTPDPGGVARVLVSITAWAPGETILWTLDVPPDLTLVEGSASWSGELDRGASKAFEITLIVPDGKIHEVNALARIEGKAARHAATLQIDLGGYEGARGLEKIVVGDGVTYIQYPGETRPAEGEDQ